jgi:hypothetical protein
MSILAFLSTSSQSQQQQEGIIPRVQSVTTMRQVLESHPRWCHAHLLARFSHDVLRQDDDGQCINEAEVASILDEVVFRYGYLEDKSAFERDFQHFLSMRVIREQSRSKEDEDRMLARLKAECSSTYTDKLACILEGKGCRDPLVHPAMPTAPPPSASDTIVQRHAAIDAAIVCVMRDAKTMRHAPLINAVIGRLWPAHFKPDLMELRARIESLIEREQLERDAWVAQTYNYTGK